MPLSFSFNDAATSDIYTLSLHDALPILPQDGRPSVIAVAASGEPATTRWSRFDDPSADKLGGPPVVGKQCELLRSEEHTSELQSLRHLVCRLLLEKKKKKHLRKHYPYRI